MKRSKTTIENGSAAADVRRRIDELNEEAWSLRSSDAEKATRIALEAKQSAAEAGYERGVAVANSTLGLIATTESRYEDARQASEEAIETFTRLDDEEGLASAYYVRAMVADFDGEPEQQREYVLKSLELSREIGAKELETAALISLGNNARAFGEMRNAIVFYTEATELAVHHGYTLHAVNARIGIAAALFSLGDVEEAMEQTRSAMEQAREIGHLRLVAFANANLATMYSTIGDLASALSHELDALHFWEKANAPRNLAASLHNIGTYYYHLGRYDSALDAIFRGLEIIERIGNKELLASGMLALGVIFETLGESSMQLDCLMRGLRLAQEIQHHLTEADALSYLGQAYQRRGDIPKALIYYFKCLEIAKKYEGTHTHQNVLWQIGEVYRVVEDYDEAAKYFTESLRLAEETSHLSGEIGVLISIGKLAAARMNYTEAIARLKQALERARSGDLLEGCRNASREIANVYRQIGDYDEAARYEHEYQHFTERIFNAEANRRVRDLMVRFEENVAIREGRRLGLDEEALDRVNAVLLRLGSRPRQVEGRVMERMQSAHQEVSAPTGEEEPALRVITFGVFRVVLAGRELTKGDWKRKRARDLFKLLIVNHRSSVSFDEIYDKLWGGERDNRKVELLVTNAATHIRKALEIEPGVPPSGFSLTCVDRSYVLDLGTGAAVDFLKFKELIVAARKSRTVEDRSRYYQEAIALYTGDFLQEDLFTEWTSYHRQVLKDAFLEGLEYFTREQLRTGHVEDAIEGARRILQHDDLSETAYRILMTGLKQCGRHGELQIVYDECHTIFQRELGAEPPEQLKALMQYPVE